MLVGVTSGMLGAANAQTPDAAARLRQVLPADIAAHVIATIAQARTRGLPGDALENRALKFAAKGVDGASIDRAISEQADRMERVRSALQSARGRKPADDEIEAGAEAMRKGIDGARVAELAKSAPGDRSLAVPLYVIGSLRDQGLPSDSAVRRVEQKLAARVSDRDLEKMTIDTPPSGDNGGGRGAELGRALGKTKNPGAANGNGKGAGGGPPAGVPGNGGKKTTPPGLAKKPTPPPGKKKP